MYKRQRRQRARCAARPAPARAWPLTGASTASVDAAAACGALGARSRQPPGERWRDGPLVAELDDGTRPCADVVGDARVAERALRAVSELCAFGGGASDAMAPGSVAAAARVAARHGVGDAVAAPARRAELGRAGVGRHVVAALARHDGDARARAAALAVSYTHLTLPTILLV